MTESEQAKAILAALNATLAPGVAYDYDKAPGAFGNKGERPARFALVDISRRFEAKRLASGEVSVSGYRIGVRYVAKSSSDARNMRALTTSVLEDQILNTEHGEIGPFVFESSEPIAPDDELMSGYDVFTF